MSEIKVGDLVVQVHDCCNQEMLGVIATVKGIDNSGTHCEFCNDESDGVTAFFKGGAGVPISWLRRIDPLSEPETIEREEETT